MFFRLGTGQASRALAAGAAALCLGLTLVASAQERIVFEELPALLLANDQLELTVIPHGGSRLG